MTKIEWTEKTWNPIVGCSRVSPGCQYCYAERMAKRLIAMGQEKYEGTIDKNGRWSGVLNFGSDKTLNEPLLNKKPTTYFVNSMSDLFHESLPFWMVKAVWLVMANAPWHTFQVLTKRPNLMRDQVDELSKTYGILKNVWLGTSVESQDYADKRIPHLLQTPAAVRFLSIEPLLGPVDLFPWLPINSGISIHDDIDNPPPPKWTREYTRTDLENNIHWVIVGGESGPNARPMNPDWVRSLRDQCTAAGVPFFFKQWGGPNKKATGRFLDGRTWDEMPVKAGEQ